MNSIVDNITREDIISEIQLLLNADIAHKKVVILVEGLDDIKFIRGMCFNIDNILVIQSYSGKLGVIDIMQNYTSEKRVISILDKDYCNKQGGEKIFYYDYCCLEMMLISSEDSFENIFKEYIYLESLSSIEFKEYLLNQLKCFSLLRKINEEENLGIEFYRISINDLYKNPILRIEFPEDVEVVNINKLALLYDSELQGETSSLEDFKDQVNKRNKEILINNKDIETRLDNEYQKKMDMVQLLEITNGHDFCEMFASVSRLHKRRGVSKNIIESTLRCSYRDSDFYKTKLFKELRDYENRNKIEMFGKLKEIGI